MKNQPFC